MKPMYQMCLEKGMEHAAAAAAERALGPPSANGKHKTLWSAQPYPHTPDTPRPIDPCVQGTRNLLFAFKPMVSYGRLGGAHRQLQLHRRLVQTDDTCQCVRDDSERVRESCGRTQFTSLQCEQRWISLQKLCSYLQIKTFYTRVQNSYVQSKLNLLYHPLLNVDLILSLPVKRVSYVMYEDKNRTHIL